MDNSHRTDTEELNNRSYSLRVCQALLDKYGVDAQFLKLIEECNELSRIAAKKLMRSEEATADNIVHEIVDVMVLISQMHVIFGREILSKLYHAKLQELVVIHELKIE